VGFVDSDTTFISCNEFHGWYVDTESDELIIGDQSHHLFLQGDPIAIMRFFSEGIEAVERWLNKGVNNGNK
jgi:hypothetical protein